MAKRIFALSCMISIAALTASPASADSIRRSVVPNGCAILAAAVFEQVTASAWYKAGGSPIAAGADPREIAICHQTARTVSAAFTRAMETMNVYVSWQDPRDVRGDVCLSGDLSQCYPHRNPFVPFNAGADLAFMLSNWSAVQTTTLRFGQPGGARDTSRFSPAALNNDLRRSLGASVVDGRGGLSP